MLKFSLGNETGSSILDLQNRIYLLEDWLVYKLPDRQFFNSTVTGMPDHHPL